MVIYCYGYFIRIGCYFLDFKFVIVDNYMNILVNEYIEIDVKVVVVISKVVLDGVYKKKIFKIISIIKN